MEQLARPTTRPVFASTTRPAVGILAFNTLLVLVFAWIPGSCLAAGTLYFSTASNASIPGVSSPYDDADIYAFDGTAYARSIDAVTDLKLPSGANLDALSVVSPNTLYISFANASITVPGLGAVADEDVLKYQNGTWSIWFSGATCGLNASDNGDIDAISVTGDTLYFSTLGNQSVSGLPGADDADVYQWVRGSSSCTQAFDASSAGLPTNANVDGLHIEGATYYLSFNRDAGTSVPGGVGIVQDESVVAYDASTSAWSLYFAGTGLNQSTGQDVDAISVDVPTIVDPTLDITAPVQGATVTGPTINVAYSISGNVGAVSQVRFKLDGGPDLADSTPDGQFQLSGVGSGTHTLDGFLVRTDQTKIGGSDAPTVVFDVSGTASDDPTVIGEWSRQIVTLPTVAVNLNLLHTGKVMFWAGHFYSAPNYGEIWDPTTNLISPVPNPFSNIFCSSNVALPDGRLLVAGGHDKQNGILGLSQASAFDPVAGTWTSLPSMSFRRWYPTLTALGDGRAIVTSGSEFSETEFVQIAEIYDPATNTWTQLSGAALSVPQYPMMYLLQDGRLLQSGSTEHPTSTRVLDLTRQEWSVVDGRVLEGGSGVMFAPNRIMKAGSASNDGATPNAASANTSYVLDMSSASPAWRETAPMTFPRTFHNLTSLADGTVLVTGGSRRKSETDLSPAVLEAELWSPATETWTRMAAMQTPRIYHSTAVLLPDARVAVSGSGNIGGATDMKNLEIYSPPYLFKGPRPTITATPEKLDYARSFSIQTPDAARIGAVNLLRPGAATHNFDMNQRFIPLTFTRGANTLEIQAPATGNIAPPGYYMLFLISDAGVPSVGKFVRFPAPYEDNTAPSVPTSLTASGGRAAVELSWGAATDNVAVVRYDVHRSSSAGFTPSNANRVAQMPATHYSDSGLSAGTYYYRVTASDAAGNVSAASNEASASVTADTSAPTVTVTNPAAGSSVTGTVTILADASDDVGVAGVEFRLDGVALAAEDVVSPYSLAWNTASTTNGVHLLTAVARDTSGNRTESLVVNVIVSNTQQTLPGLVAAYGFEDGTGTSASDSSGNGHHGTVSGATWSAQGRFGSALSFDGIDDLVTIPDANALDLTTGMTLEAWVYPTTLSGYRTVLMKEISGELAYTLYAHDDAPRPSGYARIGGNSLPVTGSSALPLNAWSHLAMTYDGTALRLYVNGTQVGTRATSGSIVTSTLPLRIGGNSVWGEYFSGRIDEVRIYNRALTTTEIQTAMTLPAVPPTVSQPTRSSPIAVDSSERRVWVVNPDNDSVSAVNADTLSLEFEITVGKHPTALAIDGFDQVWVTCRDDDTIWILGARDGSVRSTLSTDWGSAPASVVFTPDGTKGFIAYQAAGRVQQVVPASQALGKTIELGTTPRAMAVSADGSRLLVSQFVTTDGSGMVRTVDVANFVAGPAITLSIDKSSQDGSLGARGVPNYLAGLAINPGSGLAWIVGKKDNIERGLYRDGKPLTFETTVRAMVGQIDLTTNLEYSGRRIDLDNLSQPSAIAVSESGEHVFVTLQGNAKVVVLDQLGREITRADTGLAPQGLAIDPLTSRVFSQDFLGRSVSVLEGRGVMKDGAATLPRIAQVRTIGTEKLPADVLRGKSIFYNAADARMGRDGYISCASCHLDGEHDGQTWDFTDRGEGLRNTTSLKGQGGRAGAPLHWTGNFDEVQDFENDIRNFFGGTGFMSDTEFGMGTRSDPLGDAKTGVSEDLDDLAAYVDSLIDPGRSSRRKADGTMTNDALAGKVLFETLGCQLCHGGDRFTDTSTGLRHDVGTITNSSGRRRGAALDGFDTPTLLGLWATPPYLHDGSAKTLTDVFTTANPDGRHGNVNTLSTTELSQLAAYLLQLRLESP